MHHPWFMRTGMLASLLTASTALGNGQSRVVTGIVESGRSGAPLARAIVYVAGTFEQAVTNERGEFTLELPAQRHELLAQSLGYRETRVVLEGIQERVRLRLDPFWPEARLTGMQLQQDDPDFTVEIGAPAYPFGKGPVVMVDEGHHNFHTVTSRYRAFADILRLDGYRVKRFQRAFTAESLRDADVLVIATPLNGLDEGIAPNPSAFKPEEVSAVHDWVRSGGALFVIADHMPIAGAVRTLLAAFGVQLENGYTIEFDDDKPRRRTPIVFRRSDRSLRPHPIVDGATPVERIDSVATFTGLAFRVGDPFRPLLVFRDNTVSINTKVWGVFDRDTTHVRVGGWLQGAAAQLGRGRVAILGEAAMFTAQVRYAERFRNGLSSPQAGQNAEFLRGIMRWLSLR